MFLVITCQHASGACQSHSRLVLSLREASRKYTDLSHSTPPFLTLQFHEKNLTPTLNLLRIRLILPPLGHILSKKALGIDHYWGRVEFAPGRGAIHLHMICIARDKVYLRAFYQARTFEEKAEVLDKYAQEVLDMTADVNINDDPQQKPD